MPIVATLYSKVSARDELMLQVGEMINHAAGSQHVTNPWTLADMILKTVESEIEGVGSDGTVIYRSAHYEQIHRRSR